jgi:hypothetical protein
LYAGRAAPRGIARRALTVADWRLVIAVAVAQIAVAAAVRLMPLRVVRRGAARLRPLMQVIAHASDQRVVWATHAAGRRLGGVSTCLTRALAAELVLEHTTGLTLTIGVRRTADAPLEAHAWLARADRVLIGATSQDYVPLVEWAGDSA